MRHALLAVAILALAATCLAGEPYSFTIPGQGWALTMRLPQLSAYQAEDSGEGFRFLGRSADKEGIHVSFFVESSAASDSQACRTEYWKAASKNAMISKESVKLVDFGGNPGVAYVIEGEYEKRQVKAQNAHVYLAHGGKCIDIHVSRFPFADGADAQLAAIVSSATIRALE